MGYWAGASPTGKSAFPHMLGPAGPQGESLFMFDVKFLHVNQFGPYENGPGVARCSAHTGDSKNSPLLSQLCPWDRPKSRD